MNRPLCVKIVAEKFGGHVHAAVFAGFNPAARGKCGDLVFREEEWPAFRAMLARDVEVEEKRL